MTHQDQLSISNSKRIELVNDLVFDLKPIIFGVLLKLWKSVYENRKITKRHWLQQFQLSLKGILDIDEDEWTEILHDNGTKRKYMLDVLHDVYQLTAEVYHGCSQLRLKKETPLVISYVKQCTLQSAREVWQKPEVMFHITHRKDLVSDARTLVDKDIEAAIKFVIKQQVKELIAAQESIIESQSHHIDLPKHFPQQLMSSDAISLGNESDDTITDDKEGCIIDSNILDKERVIEDFQISGKSPSRQSSMSSGPSHRSPQSLSSRLPSPHPVSRASSFSSIHSIASEDREKLRRSFEEKFMVTLDDNTNRIVPFDTAKSLSRSNSIVSQDDGEFRSVFVEKEDDGKYPDPGACPKIHPNISDTPKIESKGYEHHEDTISEDRKDAITHAYPDDAEHERGVRTLPLPTSVTHVKSKEPRKEKKKVSKLATSLQKYNVYYSMPEFKHGKQFSNRTIKKSK